MGGGGKTIRVGVFRAAAVVLAYCGLLAACSPEPIAPAPVYMLGSAPGIDSNGATRLGPQPVASPARTAAVVAQPRRPIGGTTRAHQIPKLAAIAPDRPAHLEKRKARAHLAAPVATATPRYRAKASTKSSAGTIGDKSPQMIPLDDPTPAGADSAASSSPGAASSDSTTSSWASPPPAHPAPVGTAP